MRGAGALGLGLVALAAARPLQAETGYDLWLRYAPVENAQRRGEYRAALKSIFVARPATTSGSAMRPPAIRFISRRTVGWPLKS